MFCFSQMEWMLVVKVCVKNNIFKLYKSCKSKNMITLLMKYFQVQCCLVAGLDSYVTIDKRRYCVIVNNVITWTWLNLCTKVITSCFAWLQFLELTKVFGQNIFLIFKNGHFVWSNLSYSSYLMLIQAKVKQLLVRNFYWSSRNVTS